MKQQSPNKKTHPRKPLGFDQTPSAGASGTAIAPPGYGIRAVDHPILQAKSNQTRENNTGLPDHLKAGIENLSGYSLDDVRVHYNSSRPEQLNALAYTQGKEIHVAPGQERHLPHEAWHVIQQKQGRVRPTLQAKGVAINDDTGLEKEADVMGAKAIQFRPGQAEETQKLNWSHNKANDYAARQTNVPFHLKSGQVTIQRLMKKMGIADKNDYRNKCRSTVFLYAEFNGKQVGAGNGVYQTTKYDHAEANLISDITASKLQNGNLVIWLSTSPCSSIFGSRDDSEQGCQEKLEALCKSHNIKLTVKADHLYQPKEVAAMEREQGYPAGYSSFSAAVSSSYKISFHHVPHHLSSPGLVESEDIVQLQKH
jgi:Domain of unknown function (DUF4157)/APOBEC-like N-terminal domain